MVTTTVEPGDMDRLFLLVMGILIFFMQAGFSMLESGCVTKVNIDTIIFKCVLDVCCSAIAYWSIGFMFAFGGDTNANCQNCNGFIGVENPFLIGLSDLSFIYFFFELCFCTASTTIVSGAIAERMKWQGYILHSTFMAAWVYPVVSHWLWSTNGWLSITAPTSVALFQRGSLDYAGSGVVHLVGGATSFVAAKAVGYRNEFLTDEDRRTAKNAKLYLPRFEWDPKNSVWKVNELPASDKNIATLGVWILWFGWYGFNCGSIITLNGNTGLIGRVSINTTLGGSSAAIVSIAIGRIMNRDQLYLKYNLGDLNNGVLAGIVSITGNCAYTHPWAAIAIGSVGGAFYKLSSALLLHPKVRIDDPLDASPVHGFCGAWGLIANGLFAVPQFVDEAAVSPQRGGGIFYGYGLNLIIQLIEIGCITVWVMGWTMVTFGFMYLIDRNRGTNAFFFVRGQQNYGLGFGYQNPDNITTKFTNANEGTTGWINPNDVELDNMEDRKDDKPLVNHVN